MAKAKDHPDIEQTTKRLCDHLNMNRSQLIRYLIQKEAERFRYADTKALS